MKKLLFAILLLVSTNTFAEQFVCNAQGKEIRQIPVTVDVLARMGYAGGAAITIEGEPITLYDEALAKTLPEEFMNQVLAHECAHHQLGHNFVDAGDEEGTADCRSMFLLESQLNYNEKEFIIIYNTIISQEGFERTDRLQACNTMEMYRERIEITRR